MNYMKKVLTTDLEIVSLQKTGGYYYLDFKFPFIHFKEEEFYIATKSAIYKFDKKKNKFLK